MPLDGPPAQSYVQGICPARDGNLWVASEHLLRKWNGSGWVDNGIAAPWVNSPLTAFKEMPNGALAIGTQDQGLYLLMPQGEWMHFSRGNELLNDWIRSLCIDTEGNLWVATGGGGLALLRAGTIVAMNPPDQWQGRAVLSVCASRSGAVWIGTEGAGLYRIENGQWSHFGQAQGLANLFVWSVAEDTRGNLWAGTWGAGLFLRHDDVFKRAPGIQNITLPMPALLPQADGLLIGTEAGLLRYCGTNAVWIGQQPASVRADIRAIVEDKDGAIWFGALGGGLACLKNGQVQHYGKADGLSSDFVQCLHLDSSGALWIGTFGGGLDRLKNGAFAAITARQGLPNNIIGAIVDDDLGHYWMSSHAGIVRVAKANLDLCADGKTNFVHCDTFVRGDGLPTLECSTSFQPSACKTADGRIWFPTGKGLVAADPRDIHINNRPPPVAVEEVRVDGQAVAGGSTVANPLRIEPGQHRIEVDYTALSFVAPEKVQFRYRLEGLKTGWVEAGTKRSADFTYLPPGHYVFHVVACNNDGVWNKTGAAFAFELLPHFWQTTWFLVLSAAAIMAAAGMGVHLDARRRLHRKLELVERQRAVEQERARIARDIHDDLGASLTRISLLSDAVPTEQVSPPQAGEALGRIFTTSRQLVQTLDEIVWAVNPRFDTLDSLASYLGNYAQELLEAAGIRCRLDMPVSLPALPLTAEVRHILFLAFKEALNNVIKHAAASEVRITLALESGGLVLCVQDNGAGFASSPAMAAPLSKTARLTGGYGLGNMRQRLAEIGGRCEIHSLPEGGAKIQFFVPFQADSRG
jgi:signal transduction histidine kinase/streptogramin lyase